MADRGDDRQILLAWLKLLALDGDLAEPKTLRYRVLHAAGRLVRGGRKRRLKIQATWPWAEAGPMTLVAELTAAAEAEWLDGWTAGPTEDQGSGLPAGATAPDLALADHTGQGRLLSEFWAGQPGMLTRYEKARQQCLRRRLAFGPVI